jgi:nucleoside-diphosphate-sugar epimerase
MTEPPPRLLVVGGSGFIGRHVVDRALGLGWRVTSLSLRQPAPTWETGVHAICGNAADEHELKQALGGCAFEYVVNCGGYIDHTPYCTGGRRTLDSHLSSVLNLAQTLDRSVLRGFVHMGSSDEYGRNAAPQIETQREAPISPYSLSKVAATHLLQMLHRTESFPSITLRLFLTYGPRQDEGRLLPQIIAGCLKGSAFPTSWGEQVRDFCYVHDTVDAIFAALENPAARGEVINIGSGQPIRVREVIDVIRRLIGQGEPQYGRIAYRPGENMELYADIVKAQTLLRWSPATPLALGLEQTIQWFRGQA